MIYDSRKLTVELVTGRKVVLYYNPDPKTMQKVEDTLKILDKVWKDVDSGGYIMLSGVYMNAQHVVSYRVDKVRTFKKYSL